MSEGLTDTPTDKPHYIRPTLCEFNTSNIKFINIFYIDLKMAYQLYDDKIPQYRTFHTFFSLN